MSTPITPKILVPPNLDIHSSADALTITYRWWSVKHIIVAIFAFICNGYFVYLAFLDIILLVDVDWSAWALVLFGLAAAYYALAGFINRTTVRVTANDLQVTHGPLPYFGSIKLQTDDIRQIYVAEIFTKYDRRTKGYSWDLRAQLNNDAKDRTLLKGLDTPLNALYLEQEIEHYLRIDDTTVAHEKHAGTAGNEEAPRSWQTIAQAHNFKFIPGKWPETTIISGLYHGYTLGLSAFRNTYPGGVIHTRLVLASDAPQVAKTYPTPKQALRLMNQISQTLGTDELSHMIGTIKGNGQKITYEQPGVETRAKRLIYLFDSFKALLDAYPYLAELGGETIVVLKQVATDKTHKLNALVSQWLEDIAHQTQYLQNQPSRQVCQLCLTPVTTHQVNLSRLNRITFFGCRECFQSRDFYEVDHIVAILDTSMGETSQIGNTLRVNWLTHSTLFDFDSVEIIRATDEMVERFMVQLGNDTDPERAPSYKQMDCIIASDCHLSENTLRILNKTFGRVEREIISR